MNYRIASILSPESAATATTKTLDITLRKPISRITIQIKAANADNVPVAHPAKMISKIELVDGSNVLFSLSGIEAQALNFYETGRLPMNILQYIGGPMAVACFELNFGRWLWDEVLALDPTKFQNPQLKITHDLTAGGCTSTTAELSVFAHVFDKKEVAPTGFLMSKEQYNYTLGDGTREHIDLATDMPYRFLMLQALKAGQHPSGQLSQLKLAEDNDATVIINDERVMDLIKLLHYLPRISEQVMACTLAAGRTIYCTPTYEVAVVGVGMLTANALTHVDQSYGGSFVSVGDDNEQSQYVVNGMCPHGAILLPFGKQDQIEDWYDVTKVGHLELTILSGSGVSGTAQIVTQQLRKYGGAAA